MVNRKISLGSPILDEEMKAAVLDALENDRYVSGENVWKFEEEFAKYVKTKHAVSVSSGTHALQFALISCGVEHGVSVLTSTFSFIASANSIIHAGGTPIFADIDPLTYNIDPDHLEKNLTYDTEVLLPVHLYGFPAEMDKIMDIAKDRKLYVVEDACQAHGAIYRKERVGSIGDVGCFSFYPSKNMSVLGDGGMITTDNADIANTAIKLRNSGRTAKYEHDIIGYTARLNTINAAIGRIQLKRLDEWNKKRTLIAKQYFDELKELEDYIKLPPQGSSYITPVFHLFVIRTEQRDALHSWLKKTGIECGVHYPIPIPLQPIYRSLYGFKDGDFPVSERYGKTCLSLPMHPNLKMDDVHFICEQLKTFHKQS